MRLFHCAQGPDCPEAAWTEELACACPADVDCGLSDVNLGPGDIGQRPTGVTWKLLAAS